MLTARSLTDELPAQPPKKKSADILVRREKTVSQFPRSSGRPIDDDPEPGMSTPLHTSLTVAGLHSRHSFHGPLEGVYVQGSRTACSIFCAKVEFGCTPRTTTYCDPLSTNKGERSVVQRVMMAATKSPPTNQSQFARDAGADLGCRI